MALRSNEVSILLRLAGACIGVESCKCDAGRRPRHPLQRRSPRTGATRGARPRSPCDARCQRRAVALTAYSRGGTLELRESDRQRGLRFRRHQQLDRLVRRDRLGAQPLLELDDVALLDRRERHPAERRQDVAADQNLHERLRAGLQAHRRVLLQVAHVPRPRGDEPAAIRPVLLVAACSPPARG